MKVLLIRNDKALSPLIFFEKRPTLFKLIALLAKTQVPFYALEEDFEYFASKFLWTTINLIDKEAVFNAVYSFNIYLEESNGTYKYCLFLSPN